jgi:hypothetical protein
VRNYYQQFEAHQMAALMGGMPGAPMLMMPHPGQNPALYHAHAAARYQQQLDASKGMRPLGAPPGAYARVACVAGASADARCRSRFLAQA